MKIKKYISLKIISLFALYLWTTPHKCLAVSRFNEINRIVPSSYVLRRLPLRSITTPRYTNRPFIRYSKVHKNYFSSYSIFCAALGICAAHTLSFNEDIHTNYLSMTAMRARAESHGAYQANKFFEELDKILEEAKKHLDVAAGMDCVLLVGKDKNTLAHAIYHGSHTIQEVKLPNKSSHFHSPYHENVYLVPSEPIIRNGEKIFKTGDENHSITPFPEAAVMGNKVLADCPGFENTLGGARDLMNCIAISKLLRKANRVRLCYLISQEKITSQSGMAVMFRELLEVLIQILKVKEYEKISSDELKKVQIVVTHLEGNKSKGYLQAELAEALLAILPDKQEAIRHMVANVLLVDPADRLSQFEDAGYFYSNDQTTVEELKKALIEAEDDKWFAPKDFARPMTAGALQALMQMYNEIKEEAIDAFQSNRNCKARVATLLDTLKKLRKFEWINVDHYITEINKSLAAIKQGQDKNKIISALRTRMRNI